jgi:hypothetical protein
MTRKIIQIAMCGDKHGYTEVMALCNDGVLFVLDSAAQWVEMPAIPQPSSAHDLIDDLQNDV